MKSYPMQCTYMDAYHVWLTTKDPRLHDHVLRSPVFSSFPGFSVGQDASWTEAGNKGKKETIRP